MAEKPLDSQKQNQCLRKVLSQTQNCRENLVTSETIDYREVTNRLSGLNSGSLLQRFQAEKQVVQSQYQSDL